MNQISTKQQFLCQSIKAQYEQILAATNTVPHSVRGGSFQKAKAWKKLAATWRENTKKKISEQASQDDLETMLASAKVALKKIQTGDV